jgi:hypothetical protein
MAIDTAVMEQLLSNMLKLQQQQSKEQAVAFARLAKAAGLDPKLIANAESKLKTLGDAAEETAKSTTKMNKAGNMAGAALADLTSGVMGTAGNLVNFGYAAMSGTAKVSEFFAAFKDLPVIGLVAGLFSSLIKLQEEALESFSSLSESGINLGSGLSQLRIDAGTMGLTLDQMTKILKENSETLVQMGGSASLGAKNFREINKAMSAGGFQSSLLNLGFTFEQVSGVIGQYARSVGGLTQRQLKDYDGVAAAATAYGKELDFLARITGESREATQKKMEEEAMEANFQAFMASQDEDTRKKLMDGLQKSIAGAGKMGADQFKAAALGVAPLSDAAQMGASLLPEMTKTIVQQALDANNKNISSQQFLDKSTRYLATIQAQSAKGYQDQSRLFQTLQLSGDGLGAMFSFAAKNSQTLTNAQTGQNISIEENIKRLEKERRAAEEAAKKADAEAAVLRDFQKAIKDLGVELMRAFQPLIGTVIMPLIKDIAPLLPAAGKAIREFITDLFDENKRKVLFSNMIEKLGDLLAQLFRATFAVMGEKLFAQRQDNTGFQNFMNALNSVNPFAHLMDASGIPVFNRGPSTSAQPQSPLVQQIPTGRSLGSFGATGNAFENFGSGTPITAHGTEGVFTPDQINQLMKSGTSNALEGLVSQLNNTQAEMNRTLREIADYGRRNVDATNSLSGNAFA